jgi:TetR/AcrR family transcriptional regulator, transcriptional repressor for nem operon
LRFVSVGPPVEVAPHDAEFQQIITTVFRQVEGFFLKCIEAAQADGTVTHSSPARDLAPYLPDVLMGVHVLALVRPEKALLEGVIRPALSALEPLSAR